MTTLTESLERTILIRAPRAAVFRYFTDPARWAAWWGAGSTIDPRAGGDLLIRYPDGTEATGEVVEILVPERIVFTYGYANGRLIPPGGSRVTIRVRGDEDGSRVELRHEFADRAARDHHVQGWRYQLSVFSSVVSDEVHAGAASLVDSWFHAWAIDDEGARQAALSAIAAPTVRFRDRFSAVDGAADLAAHISGARRFMAGIALQRAGAVRQCQGVALADWSAVGADGQPRGGGTNVFTFGADGKISSVVGFWN